MKKLQITAPINGVFSPFCGDTTKPNFLLDWAKTRLTAEELKTLQSEKLENAKATFEAIQKRIEGAHAQRIRKEIEGEFKAEQFRGVWARAEEKAVSMFKSQGGDVDALNKSLEGVDDKGRFAKIIDYIAADTKAKIEAAEKESGNASAERVAQLVKQNAEIAAANKALKGEVEAVKAQAVKDIESTKTGFEIESRRSKVAAKMFSKDAEKKIAQGIDQSTLLDMAQLEMTRNGLTERIEGDKIVIFKGDTALQIEGTSHNHTIETYLDKVAAGRNWYVESNADKNNNKVDKGVVIDPKDEKFKNLHPSVAAQLTAEGVSKSGQF